MIIASSVATSDEKAATSEFQEIIGRLKQATGAVTDTELAKTLGIKQGAVSSAKRNLQIPPVWIAKVSKAFSVSADWLFYGTGSMQRGNAQIAPAEAQNMCPIQKDEPQRMAPEAVPSMGFTLVPKAKARLDVETGKLEMENESVCYYAFKTEFLNRKGNASKMVLLDISGDSMHPTLMERDVVMIDESQNDLVPGGIFAVALDQHILIKHLDREPGKLIIRSRNTEFHPLEIDLNKENGTEVRIVGRVVWSCREHVR